MLDTVTDATRPGLGDPVPRSRGRVVSGHRPGFAPAGLPEPTWLAAVNACPADPGRAEAVDSSLPGWSRDLACCFQPFGQDVVLGLLEGVPAARAIALLDAHAHRDAPLHAAQGNTGAYAVWRLSATDTAVAGMDSGPRPIAQAAVHRLALELGVPFAALLSEPRLYLDALMMRDPAAQALVSRLCQSAWAA